MKDNSLNNTASTSNTNEKPNKEALTEPVNQPSSAKITPPDTAVSAVAEDRRKSWKRADSSGTKINSNARQTNKLSKKKQPKDKTASFLHVTYGLKAGLNFSPKPDWLIGAFTSLQVTPKLLISPEVLFNKARRVQGSFTHASYFRPDSISPFTIADSRRISVLEIPITIQYRLTPSISIKAGPVLSFPFRQRDGDTRISVLPDRRDTLNNSKTVSTALTQTAFKPKVQVAVTGGVAYYVNRFIVEARFLKNLSSYQVTSPLGSYNQNYQSIQLSIGYQLSPKRNK